MKPDLKPPKVRFGLMSARFKSTGDFFKVLDVNGDGTWASRFNTEPLVRRVGLRGCIVLKRNTIPIIEAPVSGRCRAMGKA